MRRSRQRTASRWRLFVSTPGPDRRFASWSFFTLMAIVGPYLYPGNLPINSGQHLRAAEPGPPARHRLRGHRRAGADRDRFPVRAARGGDRGARSPWSSAPRRAWRPGYYPPARGQRDHAGNGLRARDPGLPGADRAVDDLALRLAAARWASSSASSAGAASPGPSARRRCRCASAGSWRPRAAWACPARHIILAEMLPNVAPFIGDEPDARDHRRSIYAEVGLFFLGVVPFNTNNWGVMLNNAVFQAGAVTSPQGARLPAVAAGLHPADNPCAGDARERGRRVLQPEAEADLMAGTGADAGRAGGRRGPGPDGPRRRVRGRPGARTSRSRSATRRAAARGRRACRWISPAARSPAWSASPGRASRRWR